MTEQQPITSKAPARDAGPASADGPPPAELRRARRPAGPLILVQAILLLVGFIHTAVAGPIGTNDAPLRMDYALAVLQCAWAIATWVWLTGSTTDVYMLFLFAASATCASGPFMELLGVIPQPVVGQWYNLAVTADSAAVAARLVYLCICSMHLGAMWTWSRSRRGRPETAPAPSTMRSGDLALRVTGLALMCVSAPATVVEAVRKIRAVSSGGYLALYNQASTGGTQQLMVGVLAAWLVPGCFLLYAGSANRRPMRVVATLGVLAASAVSLSVGRRGDALLPMLVFGSLAVTLRRRPIRIQTLAMAGAALAALSPLVVLVRLIGVQNVTVDVVREAATTTDNPVGFMLQDVDSFRVVAQTVELVPTSRPYEGGVGYADAAMRVLPNFALPIELTSAYGFPDQWFARELAPGLAAAGGGFGFNFVAEAYLQFGAYGAPFVTALLGMLFGWLAAASARSRDPATSALIAAFTVGCLFIPRNTSYFVRDAVWNSMIPCWLLYAVWRGMRSMAVVSAVSADASDQSDPPAGSDWCPGRGEGTDSR